MKPRILVVGNTYIDFVCRAETMPERGQVLVSELGYAFVTSGGGAFEAVGASRQGADVVLCTKLGNDAYASQLKKKFAAENVDTRFVGVHKPSQTGLCVTVCENTGRDRVIISSAGKLFITYIAGTAMIPPTIPTITGITLSLIFLLALHPIPTR